MVHMVGRFRRVTRRLGYPMRLGPAALLPAIVSAGLLASLLPAATVQAEIGGCRSDPVVVLSNGVSLDLSATIADSASDVRQTTYILHAPAGTQVVGVVGTDGVIGLTERFYFSADSAANTYTTQTVVDTWTPGIGVTATTAVVSASQTVMASAAGLSHQELAVVVSS